MHDHSLVELIINGEKSKLSIWWSNTDFFKITVLVAFYLRSKPCAFTQ